MRCESMLRHLQWIRILPFDLIAHALFPHLAETVPILRSQFLLSTAAVYHALTSTEYK